MALRDSSTCLMNLFTTMDSNQFKKYSREALKLYYDKKDKDLNTPLNISVMYGNMNISNLLITKS